MFLHMSAGNTFPSSRAHSNDGDGNGSNTLKWWIIVSVSQASPFVYDVGLTPSYAPTKSFVGEIGNVYRRNYAVILGTTAPYYSTELLLWLLNCAREVDDNQMALSTFDHLIGTPSSRSTRH